MKGPREVSPQDPLDALVHRTLLVGLIEHGRIESHAALAESLQCVTR